jgi:hypothetical protein
LLTGARQWAADAATAVFISVAQKIRERTGNVVSARTAGAIAAAGLSTGLIAGLAGGTGALTRLTGLSRTLTFPG